MNFMISESPRQQGSQVSDYSAEELVDFHTFFPSSHKLTSFDRFNIQKSTLFMIRCNASVVMHESYHQHQCGYYHTAGYAFYLQSC